MYDKDLFNKNKFILIAIFVIGLAGGMMGSLVIAKYNLLTAPNSTLPIRSRSFSFSAPAGEELTTQQVVKLAQPSVVSIAAFTETSLFNSTGPGMFDDSFGELPITREQGSQTEMRQVSGGSGFIISPDGLILTNRHVVADKDVQYRVTLNDGQVYDAKVLARDTINDIAFLKIEAKDLTPLPLGESDKIQIGQTVIAIGNALSEYTNTVTRGIISGIGRKVSANDSLGQASTLDSAIQTDAAINPGNSGGPLLNLAGEVIGINTAVDRSGEGIGFAIPINEAKTQITDVLAYGKIIRPFLGVRYVLINPVIARKYQLPVDNGAYVVSSQSGANDSIVKGSPAELAGILEGDIIYQVEGKDVTVEDGLALLLSKYAPGDQVKLAVKRNGEDMEVMVTLTERGEQ